MRGENGALRAPNGASKPTGEPEQTEEREDEEPRHPEASSRELPTLVFELLPAGHEDVPLVDLSSGTEHEEQVASNVVAAAEGSLTREPQLRVPHLSAPEFDADDLARSRKRAGSTAHVTAPAVTASALELRRQRKLEGSAVEKPLGPHRERELGIGTARRIVRKSHASEFDHRAQR